MHRPASDFGHAAIADCSYSPQEGAALSGAPLAAIQKAITTRKIPARVIGPAKWRQLDETALLALRSSALPVALCLSLGAAYQLLRRTSAPLCDSFAPIHCKLASESFKRYILSDSVVRNEQVCPWLALVACSVIRRSAAPFDGNIPLREDIRIRHLVRGFGLQHVDLLIGFRGEARLVLEVLDAGWIEHLELPFGP